MTKKQCFIPVGILIVLCSLACFQPAPSNQQSSMDMSGADLVVEDMSIQDMDGQALVTQNRAWQWVDFPDSTCGNGQSTGIGVNLSETSTDVLVFIQGGGACWDVNTCFVLKSAAFLESGYGEANFKQESVKQAALFDRSDEMNPFKEASYIFVPYCTGDLHNGDRVKPYTALGQTKKIHHRGAHNISTFLKRLAPTFPNERAVYLAGASAGGYGVQFNYERFVKALPEAKIHLMSDCAPMVQPYDGRFGAMKQAWDFQNDTDCQACDTALHEWPPYLFKKYPDRRFGLMAYDADEVIRLYFGYPIDPTPFKNRLKLLIDEHYAPQDNAHVFVKNDKKHVMLGEIKTLKQDNITALQWLTWWKRGDAQWRSLRQQ